MDDTSRRAFLKALGLGAASLAACERIPVRHAMPFLVPAEEVTPGVPTFYASTCSGCSAACGTMVKVLAGRPVKLEGNPDHPLSKGGLCAIGQAELRALYDPSRLQGPTVSGAASSWSEVDELVRGRLQRVANDGSAVRVLSSTIASPAARDAVAAFLAPYDGRLIEHDFDPQRPSAALEASEIVFGEAKSPSPKLDKVDVLVSFASDLFGTGCDPVVHTGQWAARRRDSGWRNAPRHVQIEGSLSLTGAGADERWSATASERRTLAMGLLRLVAERLEVEAPPSLPTPSAERERLAGLVDELVASRGRSVVVSSDNDRDTQLAVALTNRLLDAPLDFKRPSGDDRELAALVDELSAGRVGALFVLGVDVVRFLPSIAASLGQLPLSVAITQRANETTAACQVVASAHHGIECWSDMEPRPGLVTLAQPTVRPLFDTRHPHENFLAWGDGGATDWRGYLETSWQQYGVDWTDAVRSAGLAKTPAVSASPAPEVAEVDEVADVAAVEVVEVAEVPEVATPEVDVASAFAQFGSALEPSSELGELNVELTAEVALREPSHAANPWLRELPDPITRVAWVPTIRLAPELAAEREIEDGDVVQVQTDDGAVAMPARIVPGQDPRVLSVPLGYDDNAYALARLDTGKLEFARPARLDRTGRRVQLPLFQVHSETEGRPIVHQISEPHEEVHVPHHPEASLWPEHVVTSPHWEMVIDLDACTGCSACVVACQAENNIPVVGEEEVTLHRDMHWLRMDRYYLGDDVVFEPMLCAQCDNAPCETVCPVAATVHSEDGLNQQVYNRCVGTRYCANNCPYKVRRFNWFDQQPSDPIERLVLNPDVVVRSRGVMEKCTFCVQRIQGARIAAKREDRERFEVETACQQSCPAQAIYFGDGADAGSRVSELAHKPRAFQVLAELGIKPSVTYLARIRNRGDS